MSKKISEKLEIVAVDAVARLELAMTSTDEKIATDAAKDLLSRAGYPAQRELPQGGNNQINIFSDPKQLTELLSGLAQIGGNFVPTEIEAEIEVVE